MQGEREMTEWQRATSNARLNGDPITDSEAPGRCQKGLNTEGMGGVVAAVVMARSSLI